MKTKQCTKCGEEKPATAEYFSREKTKRDELRSQCKNCVNESNRAYREANPERAKEYSRAWREANPERVKERNRAYHEANQERRAETNRAWHEANRERENERSRAWREANLESAKERERAYRKANPEVDRAKSHRRRAREHTAEGSHTAEDIKAQYKRQKGECFWCNEKVGDNYHVDHVVPLSRGGSDSPDNLVISCPGCNCSKGDRMPHEWAQGNRLL